MSDVIVTNSPEDQKYAISLSSAEIQFLNNLIDNIQISGIEAIQLIASIASKLEPYVVSES